MDKTEQISELMETGQLEEAQDLLDYPYGGLVERVDIEKELELLSDEDPITGAILNLED